MAVSIRLLSRSRVEPIDVSLDCGSLGSTGAPAGKTSDRHKHGLRSILFEGAHRDSKAPAASCDLDYTAKIEEMLALRFAEDKGSAAHQRAWLRVPEAGAKLVPILDPFGLLSVHRGLECL